MTELTERMERKACRRRTVWSSSRRAWTSRTSAAASSTIANLPPGANVLFMTIMATKMLFVGRG